MAGIQTLALIRKWAEDRNLIEGSDPFRQLPKLVEELGEACGGLVRGDIEKYKDGLGDAVVVLVIMAAQKGLTLEECIDYAYNEIKDRKGKMVDGVFIKEQDLPKD